MPDRGQMDELVAYLTRSSRLTPREISRLIEEVLAFLNESAEEFICRRHRELQRGGYSNPEIFARLQAELAARRFRAPEYSERQVRRIVYG